MKEEELMEKLRVLGIDIKEETSAQKLLEELEKIKINELEQKQLEKNKLIQVIKQNPVAVVITGKDGVIEYVNPKFEEITGYKSKEALGQTPRILKSEKHSDKFYENLWGRIKSAKTWEGEICNFKKDGTLYWEKAVIFPVTDADGIIKNYIKLAEDITEEKQIKEKLEYKNQLEQLIRNLALNFINIDLSNIDQDITDALEIISVFTDACYTFLYKADEERENFKLEYSWDSESCKTGYPVTSIKREEFPWLFKEMKYLQPISLAEIDNPSEQATKEIKRLKDDDVDETVVVPMIYEDEFNGIITFNFCNVDSIAEDMIYIFRITAEMFANALGRKKSDEKLKEYTKELEYTNQALEKTYQQLSEEMEKGRVLHEQFLPDEFPKLDKFSFGSFYKPAKKLGGDFYNVIKIDNRLLFYIVDIMGHGLDGAILNIFIRESINSYIFANHSQGQKISPKELISFIHRRFCGESFPDDYFICLIMGVVNLNTMELSISNAGVQNPPLLVNENGKVEELPVSGLPLSKAIRSCEFLAENIREEKIKITPGDSILLTTDGIIEERIDNDEIYGFERVKNSMSHNYFLSAQLIIDSIVSDYKKLRGDVKSNDDITLFALKYRANREDDFYRKERSSYKYWEEVIVEAEDFLRQYFTEIDFMMIGLREIICNAVEHGNQNDPNKFVELRINIYHEHVCITVVDEGNGFDWEQKLSEERNYHSNRDRGRGVYITEMAFDYLYYNPAGNKAVMVKIKEGDSKDE